MVQPEEGIEGRDLQSPHVTISARLIMDLVVHVFETAELAGVRGCVVPSIIRKCIEIGV